MNLLTSLNAREQEISWIRLCMSRDTYLYGLSYPKNPENPPLKFKKIVKKNQEKNFSIEFILQSSKYSAIIPKIDRLSWKTEWKTEKSRQIAENLPIFSISRSSANFGEGSRSRGVMKSIPRRIEEWKKVQGSRDEEFLVPSLHTLRKQSKIILGIT